MSLCCFFWVHRSQKRLGQSEEHGMMPGSLRGLHGMVF